MTVNLTLVMMRLRLQMLMPGSAKCIWKWRMSSGVAVSGNAEECREAFAAIDVAAL